MKKTKETQNVRIDKKVISKVRKKTDITRQSIGGYFEISALEKLEREKGGKSTYLRTDIIGDGL
jgi:hypothetical protein